MVFHHIYISKYMYRFSETNIFKYTSNVNILTFLYKDEYLDFPPKIVQNHNLRFLDIAKQNVSSMTTQVIKYVGRTTNFKGKTLWEIVGSLKNYGVGRIIVRSVFARYSEPSFMKIVKVETCPDEERRRVRVWVEKTFRGKTLLKLTEIYRTSYKPDYNLIPKDEEKKLLDAVKSSQTEVILPNKIEMPPLMKKFIVKDHEKKGLETIKEFVMPLSYNHSPNRTGRIAQGDEKPTIEFTMNLGKPANLSLYEGVHLQ